MLTLALIFRLHSVVALADEETKQKFKGDVERFGKECFESHPIKEGKIYTLTPNPVHCPIKKSTRLNL
jgi:hypothetical protein